MSLPLFPLILSILCASQPFTGSIAAETNKANIQKTQTKPPQKPAVSAQKKLVPNKKVIAASALTASTALLASPTTIKEELRIPEHTPATTSEVLPSIQRIQLHIEQNQLTAAAQLIVQLRSDPLYPFAAFLWLNAKHDVFPATELSQYLQQHGHTGWADTLKRTWSERLGKTKQWSTLTQYAWMFPKNDARCWVLQAQKNLSTPLDEDWYEEVTLDWLTKTNTSEVCQANHDTLITSGKLEEIHWQQKFSQLIFANKTADIYPLLKQVPPSLKEYTSKLSSHLATPEQTLLAMLAHPNVTPEKQHQFMTLSRILMQQSPEKLLDIWQQGKETFVLHPLWIEPFERQLWQIMAKRQPEQAETWLSKIAPNQHNETTLTPLINQALAKSDWKKLLSYCDLLPKELQQEDRWVYWRAKAMQALGQTEESQLLFELLATKRSFYGFIAADARTQPYQLNREQVSTAQIEQVEQQPLLKRLRALYTSGLKDVAWKEWNYQRNTGGVALSDIPAYAQIALGWGWASFSVLSLGHPQHWNYIDLRFPMPYYTLLSQHAERHQIPLAWAFGITRRESAYAPDVTSRSGAMGLMQLMPKTAKALHKINNIHDVYQPDLNVHLGTKLLGQLKSSFNDNFVLSTAAYNAGGFRVKQWLQKYPNLPTDQWIELIPFKETRDYVKAVLEYMLVFERLGNLPNTQISHYLQPIHSEKVAENRCNPSIEWCL